MHAPLSPFRSTRRAFLKASCGLLLAAPALVAGGGRAHEVLRVFPGESIQGAIDKAPAGSTVRVEPGAYRETLVIDKPLRLTAAAGPEVTILRAAPERFEYETGPVHEYIVGAINVMDTRDVVVEGLTVTGGLEGIWLSRTWDSTVNRCIAFGNRSSGYYVWASQNVELVQSVGYDNAVGAYEGQSGNVSMRECAFLFNKGGVAPHLGGRYGLAFPGIGALCGNLSSGGDIAGCRCVGNSDAGVQINARVQNKAVMDCLVTASPVGIAIGERVRGVRGNSIVGNTEWGLRTALTVDARENWWGDPSGPSGAGSGRGDAVAESAEFDPWLVEPAEIPRIALWP